MVRKAQVFCVLNQTSTGRRIAAKEPAGNELAQFAWFWKNGKFTGERINDVHLTIAEKQSGS